VIDVRERRALVGSDPRKGRMRSRMIHFNVCPVDSDCIFWWKAMYTHPVGIFRCHRIGGCNREKKKESAGKKRPEKGKGEE